MQISLILPTIERHSALLAWMDLHVAIPSIAIVRFLKATNEREDIDL